MTPNVYISLLYKWNGIPVDNYSIKCIEYNRILWKFNRQCYSPFGWTCLSRHYAEFIWTFETKYSIIGLSKEEMDRLGEYATDPDVNPFRYKTLKPIDEEMFIKNCDQLVYMMHKILGHKKFTLGCEEED